MTGFTADPEELRAHAGRLCGYADRLADLGAPLPEALGEQSLGSFASFLTAGLGGAMSASRAAFTHVASTVDLVGGGVRQSADDVARADDDGAAGLTAVQEGR